MKNQNSLKKLALNKKTVAKLDRDSLANLQGGFKDTMASIPGCNDSMIKIDSGCVSHTLCETLF